MEIINVEHRDAAVKAKKLRRMGKVPCSVYGGALKESVAIAMDQQAANQMYRSCRVGSRVNLKLDGEVIPTQIKELDLNPDNQDVFQVSFQALQAGHMVNSVLQIYHAHTENVRGILEQMIDEVPYESLPRDMIDSVTLDLTGAGVGTVITLADIPELNTGKITMHLPADSIVLRITEPRAAEEPEEAEAAE